MGRGVYPEEDLKHFLRAELRSAEVERGGGFTDPYFGSDDSYVSAVGGFEELSSYSQSD